MQSLLCTCARLRRSARIASALYDAALAPSGFTVAQFSLLRMLQRAGPSTLTGLAAETGFDRTTLNRTLAPLEARGWVESRPGADRRSRTVAVTDDARALMREAQPRWEEAEAKIRHAIGPDNTRLFAILDRIEELAT